MRRRTGADSRSEHGARRRRRAPLALLAVVVAVGGSGGGLATGDRAIARTDLAHTDVVTISSTPLGNPVPGAFVGISLEYGSVFSAELPGPGGADRVLAQLIRNLSPGYSPIIRIGGDSGDKTWWPIAGMPRPRGINFALTPAWLADARALARSAHARLILGINLEANSTAIASIEARHLVAGVGRRNIAALEIGNEPELYAGIPWYVTRAGQKGFGRPLTYNLAEYMKEFAKIAGALPPVPLAGPSTGADAWIAGLGPLLAANPSLRLATFHAYALDPKGNAFRGHDCSTAIGEPAHPSIGALLDSYASQNLVRGALPYIAIAHSHGIPFRIDEMNAITCAGAPGVSNTAASALWVLDELFRLVRAGVDGVNIHTWRGSAGKLFDMHYRHGRWVGSVQPEYYGLLMFVQAAPPGSRLLTTKGASAGPLRSWAVEAPDHSIRVVLINDGLKHTRWVLVRPPAPSRRATLERLEAPSAHARKGVTLSGQSFSRQTTTGRLAGSRDVTLLQPQDGDYTVRVPPASAVTLTIR
ncbi:MAG TPA: glycosyl hydrolase family 79 C-terminal domain-containing protein [Solirubrobacteraceae bacterium]|nr:glycosyl hydrolase family 79 C-terminal domain-containing protein [Solirubrobacteraceae bacterium]